MSTPKFILVTKLSGQPCHIQINGIDSVEPISTNPHIKCTMWVRGRKIELNTPYLDVLGYLANHGAVTPAPPKMSSSCDEK